MNIQVAKIIGGFCAGVIIGFLVGDHIATKRHNVKVEKLENKYKEIVDDLTSEPAEQVVYEHELTEEEVGEYARLLFKQQNADAIQYAKEHGDDIDEPYFSDVENRGGVEILTGQEVTDAIAELQNINRSDKILKGKMVEQIEEADWGTLGYDEKVYTFYRPDRVMIDRQTDLLVIDAVVLEEPFDVSWMVDLTNPTDKTMTIQDMLIQWPREETVWLRDNAHMTDFEIDIVDVEFM